LLLRSVRDLLCRFPDAHSGHGFWYLPEWRGSANDVAAVSADDPDWRVGEMAQDVVAVLRCVHGRRLASRFCAASVQCARDGRSRASHFHSLCGSPRVCVHRLADDGVVNSRVPPAGNQYIQAMDLTKAWTGAADGACREIKAHWPPPSDAKRSAIALGHYSFSGPVAEPLLRVNSRRWRSPPQFGRPQLRA
jgi:hypothetical protein